MNIRLSCDTIRIRLSHAEASELLEKDSISERLFLDTEVPMDLRVALHSGDSLEWRVHHAPKNELAVWNCDIPRAGFKALLCDTAKKDALIRVEKRLPDGKCLTIVIEVDIWDEEKRSRAKR